MLETTSGGFRLSPQQRRIWSISEGAARFRGDCAITVHGAIDPASLRLALVNVAASSQILRMAFRKQPGLTLPLQIPRDGGVPRWREISAKVDSAAAALECAMREPLATSFDLAAGDVLHATWVDGGSSGSWLLLSLSALCGDGWTMPHLVRAIAETYEGKPKQFEEVPYVQVAEWQNGLLEDEDATAGRDYWRNQRLDDFRPPLPFAGQGQGQGQDGALSSVTDPWIVPRDIDESLRRLSLRTGTPLSAPWFAAWCTALMRISSVAEIVVADVADGREHEAVARAPGIFARHVPVRLAVNLDIPFEQMVRRTDQIRNVAREWGDHFSWETLPPRTQHNGLEAPAYLPFSFCYEEYQRRWRVRGGEFSIDARRQLFEGQHFALRVVRTENDLAVELQYDATRVSRADATRALGYLGNLVTAAAADPEARAASLRLLRADERRELLGDVATATTRLPAAGCFHEAFARLAAEKPDATAVACLEASLSYRELDRKASLLARALRERGIRPEARVGLLTERSTDVLVGVLGIWKAGGVYVPLDPTQPPERLEFILNDAGVGLVLTQRSMSDLLPASLARLGIDGTWSDDTRYPERSPVAATSSQNLAYVIYTSGSSGQPKGVMVSHASLLNLVSGLNDTIYRGRGVQRVSLNAPLTFDASIKQIATLALGMTVDIIPEEVRADPQRTLEYLASRSIDVLECTPFQFGRLLDAGWTSNGDARRPSVVLLGGESVEVSLLQAFLGDARTTLFNMYGPTECTVDVAVGRLASERDAAIVGRPLANVRAYILDGNLEPVPRGVVGELFVGGLGVARGYLGRPGLTAACFVPDPFGGHGGRLYRTGDAASYEADGRIRIRGRLDRQVKVRGVRVEPGEIEELLRRQPDIRDAAVLVEQSNAADPRIVAYVVPKAGRAPAVVEGARTEARRALPTYMVPTDFVLLERLPLTANGKLDYAALPELAAASRRADVPYVEPRSEIERKIAQIWREELQVAHFGIQDNFFDLGGHSLLMARVHARLCATFGREITLVEMFRYPTVGLLAKYFAGYERVEGHTVEEAVGRATRRRLRRGRAGERDV